MRIRKVATVAAAAGFGLLMFTPASAQAEDAVRIISNASSAKAPDAVDAEGHGTKDNTPVIGHPLKASDKENQLWFISSVQGSETVTIRGKESGKCVTPTESHGEVVLLTCDPGRLAAQQWYESGSPNRRSYENVLFSGEALAYEGSKNQLNIREVDLDDESQTWKLER